MVLFVTKNVIFSRRSLKGTDKKKEYHEKKKRLSLEQDDLKLSVLTFDAQGGKKTFDLCQEKLETECLLTLFLTWICKRSISRTKNSLETKEISFGFVVFFLFSCIVV